MWCHQHRFVSDGEIHPNDLNSALSQSLKTTKQCLPYISNKPFGVFDNYTKRLIKSSATVVVGNVKSRRDLQVIFLPCGLNSDSNLTNKIITCHNDNNT